MLSPFACGHGGASTKPAQADGPPRGAADGVAPPWAVPRGWPDGAAVSMIDDAGHRLGGAGGPSHQPPPTRPRGPGPDGPPCLPIAGERRVSMIDARVVGSLSLEIHDNAASLERRRPRQPGSSSRRSGAEGPAHVMFATGDSQLLMVEQLTAGGTGVPWPSVIGFHMDEYLGLGPDHPAGFARWIHQRIAERVPLRAVHYPPPGGSARRLGAGRPQGPGRPPGPGGPDRHVVPGIRPATDAPRLALPRSGVGRPSRLSCRVTGARANRRGTRFVGP